MNSRNLEKIFICWGILINVLLLIFIFRSPANAVYDEKFFYENFQLLIQKGWSTDYILNYKNQAPGPLFQAFYYLLFKIGFPTSVHVTRYFSLFFFNAGLWLFCKAFHKTTTLRFWVIYFSLFSVPFVYPILGMGLTETISMFFLSAGIYFFKFFIDRHKIMYVLFFAVCYSLALIGRQNYLIIFPVFLFFLLYEKMKMTEKITSVILCFVSLVPLLYLIHIWHGLVPPEQMGVSGGSLFAISLQNGLLGLGYSGILFFIVNPEYFTVYLSKKITGITFLASFILQLIAKIEFLPFLSLFNKMSSIPQILYYICPYFLIVIGIYSIIVLASLFVSGLKNRDTILVTSLGIFMAFSSFKIVHLFSSRYVAQSGYLATGVSKEYLPVRLQWIKLVFLIGGSLAGLYSLHIYYSGN